MKPISEPEVQLLLSDLGITHPTLLSDDYSHNRSHMDDVKLEKEKRKDAYRLLLIELIYLISVAFPEVDFPEGIHSKKEFYQRFINIIKKMILLPKKGRAIILRYRGEKIRQEAASLRDYVIFWGDIILDFQIADEMFDRRGDQYSHLTHRLEQAFHHFFSHGIGVLFLKLPSELSKNVESIRIPLELLSGWTPAVASNGSIAFIKNKKQATVPPIKDENGQPDFNLTLLAALNGMKPANVTALVQKVDMKIRNAANLSEAPYIDAYHALFSIRQLKDKITPPPLEINNIRWLIATDSANPEPGKTKIARFIKTVAQNQPLEEALLTESLFGASMDELSPVKAGEKLKRISEFITFLDDLPAEKALQDQIISGITDQLENLPVDKINRLSIQDGSLSVNIDETVTDIGAIHPFLAQPIHLIQGRISTRKKMKDMIKEDVVFDDTDFIVIAEDFRISGEDAKLFISLIRDCFAEGHFRKIAFEKNIDTFIQHETRIFPLLWHYLKEIVNRTDRLSFLNAFQFLTPKMKNAKSAVRILLTDILTDPDIVNYSDRNALMLINMLLRKYNKEFHMDIEMTPEEVVMVKEGLDDETVAVTAMMIDAARPVFLHKTASIDKKIIEALGPEKSGAQKMPLRYLISLEREVLILLSLVEGFTARNIIRTAIRQYGNPKSKLYSQEKSVHHLSSLLQQLKLIIRCLGRVGEKRDLPLLDEVILWQEEFIRLSNTDSLKDRIDQIVRWAENTRKTIA